MAGLHRSVRWLVVAGLFGIIVVAGLVEGLGDLLFFGRLHAEGWEVGLAAAAAVAVVPFYGALILSLDSREPEPLALTAAAFLWGATVSSVLAWFFYLLLAPLTNAFCPSPLIGCDRADVRALLAGPVEETAKGAALLVLIFLTAEIDDVVDGIVYGAMVGLGFAMAENLGYYVRALIPGSFVVS
jgi:RsiW-degrading membrane proteinase PrsW (M82 family)